MANPISYSFQWYIVRRTVLVMRGCYIKLEKSHSQQGLISQVIKPSVPPLMFTTGKLLLGKENDKYSNTLSWLNCLSIVFKLYWLCFSKKQWNVSRLMGRELSSVSLLNCCLNKEPVKFTIGHIHCGVGREHKECLIQPLQCAGKSIKLSLRCAWPVSS